MIIFHGASSGSIVATLYACGFTPNEIYDIFKKYANTIKYVDFKNILKLIFGIIFKRKIIINGLNSGEKIYKLVNKCCKMKKISNINEVPMPLIISSVNIYNGEIYMFSSKQHRVKISDDLIYENSIDLGKAVQASCSYPGVFSPCKYKNIELIDGGIRENIPWKALKQIGANEVIAVTFEKELKEKCCKNIPEVIENSIDLLCHELGTYEVEGADYNIKIRTSDVKLLDIRKIDELFEYGYMQAKNFIKTKYNT